MKLATKEWGTEHSTNLVFLHGMGGVGALWRPIAAVLEDHYRIIAVDQRGHGGSRPVPFDARAQRPDFSPAAFGSDVIETLSDMQVSKAFFVGHSMGVRTAVACAHLDPDRVQGLALIDLGFSGPAGGGLGKTLADFLRILPEQFASRAAARQYMVDHCPEVSIGQYLMAVSSVNEHGVVTFPFDHSSLIDTIDASIQISTEAWLKAFAETGKPILVIRGENSAVYLRERYLQEYERFKNYLNVRFVEMKGTGHGLPFEKRKEFCEKITQWVSSAS